MMWSEPPVLPNAMTSSCHSPMAMTPELETGACISLVVKPSASVWLAFPISDLLAALVGLVLLILEMRKINQLVAQSRVV